MSTESKSIQGWLYSLLSLTASTWQSGLHKRAAKLYGKEEHIKYPLLVKVTQYSIYSGTT